MTISAEDFATIALSFPEAVQAAHMGQTDFRVAKKIFATLNVDAGLGTLKLSLEQQQLLIAAHDAVFFAEPNSWGARGWTKLRLDLATAEILRPAMRMAFVTVAPKRLSAAVSDG